MTTARRQNYKPGEIKRGPLLVKLKRRYQVPWHEILGADNFHTTSMCGIVMQNSDTIVKTRGQVRSMKKPKRCELCKGVLARHGLEEPRGTEEVNLPDVAETDEPASQEHKAEEGSETQEG